MGAHIIRATITMVANMCIKRTPKEEEKAGTKDQHKSHAIGESEYSDSDSGSESFKSTDEAYDAEIKGLEGSKVEAEVI